MSSEYYLTLDDACLLTERIEMPLLVGLHVLPGLTRIVEKPDVHHRYVLLTLGYRFGLGQQFSRRAAEGAEPPQSIGKRLGMSLSVWLCALSDSARERKRMPQGGLSKAGKNKKSKEKPVFIV